MKINKKIIMTTFGLGLLAAPMCWAADGIEINHLGTNNTLVRVNGEGNYLILPIQETFDDARINVIVDGKLEETIYARLAKTKTDYTVPYDISKYKGKNLILEVVTPQDRNSVRDAKDDICW